MLLIAYRPHDLSKITVAPYLIPITRELEDVKVGELLSMVHAKFAESLSPFVSKRHLQLLLKNGQPLLLNLPLFMYLDYQLTLQEIHCVVHPESVIDRLNERTSKLASCLVLRVVTAGKSLTLIGKSIASDLAIISRTSLETLDQMVKGDHVLVVNNCVITLDKKEAKWSQWLQQTWNKYSVEGDCVFSCLIRSEYLLSEYEG